VVNPRVQNPSSAAEMEKAAAIAKITEASSNDLFERRASDGTPTRTATTGDCASRGTVIFQNPFLRFLSCPFGPRGRRGSAPNRNAFRLAGEMD
jgi:hypothetical protein